MMWAHVINAYLGVWLMASPVFFDYQGIGRTNELIIGPIAATFAIIAVWAITRVLGKINVALGMWLVVAPWVLGYESMIPTIHHSIVGITLSALAMTRVTTAGKFGGGWSSLWRPVEH